MGSHWFTFRSPTLLLSMRQSLSCSFFKQFQNIIQQSFVFSSLIIIKLKIYHSTLLFLRVLPHFNKYIGSQHSIYTLKFFFLKTQLKYYHFSKPIQILEQQCYYINTNMNKNKILLCALFVILCQSQTFNYQNAGCATFDASGTCLTCKDRYYMYTLLNLCLPVSPLCKEYSILNGACTSCIDGFALTQGQCQPSYTLIQIPKNQINCASYNSASQICDRCNDGFVTVNGGCIKTILGCDVYSVDGKCMKCINGFTLNGSACVKVQVIVPVDPNCKTSDSIRCIECKDGFLLTSQATCIKISPLCNKYNIDGVCIECDVNFNLDAGKCYPKDMPSIRATYYDPLCSRFQKGTCVKCSAGALFDNKGVCKFGNPLCKQMDSNGACTSCYPGYQVKDLTCVVVVLELDPNCNLFENGKCIRCSQGAYFDTMGKCVIADPNCRKWNKGVCESCYPGFVMNDKGACIIDTDFNCADYSNGQCNKCSKGYYLDAGRCKIINTLCAKFDFVNKKCVGCYQGYALYQGECTQFSKLPDLSGVNVYCKLYDETGKCLQCYDRYFMQYGKCVQVSPFCKTFHSTKGYCLSCYEGYHIDEQGDCVVNTI